MKGIVYHGERDVRVENLPDPTPPDTRGAVIKIEGTAICGSDLHLYHANFPLEGGIRLGHEFVGEVVETGSDVKQYKAGDRVIVSGVIGCGDCVHCARGEVVRCLAQAARVFGTSQELDGGQAEAAAVPIADHALTPIPDGISLEQAVLLTDILPTGFFGAKMADISPGDTVVIIGAGPVGIQALLSAQLFGPAQVLQVDRVPERLALAEKLGATPVHADQADAMIAEATDGLGAHSVIEAVGLDATIASAFGWARAGGTVSVIGVNMSESLPFPMQAAFMKDLTFRTGLVPVPELWPALIPLVAGGRLHPEVVFSHRMGLSEGAEAYRAFDARENGVMKILLDPAR